MNAGQSVDEASCTNALPILSRQLCVVYQTDAVQYRTADKPKVAWLSPNKKFVVQTQALSVLPSVVPSIRKGFKTTGNNMQVGQPFYLMHCQ